MPRRKHTHRERLLVTGAVLLVLLATGVLLTGRIINRRAGQMSDHIVAQISESHGLLLQAELDRTEKILSTAADFLRMHAEASDDDLEVLATTLLKVDTKAETVWFATPGNEDLRRYSCGGSIPACGTDHRTTSAGDSRTEKRYPRLHDDSRTDTIPVDSGMHTTIVERGGIRIWVLTATVRNTAGQLCTCGIDYPLSKLYAYMSEQRPHSRSSAMLLDPEGKIVFHPDSLQLGQTLTDDAAREAFREVATTGRRVVTEAFSDYLGVEEQRIYYPIRLGNERWVAGIGIPRLVIEQEIDDFHLYTILTALISVLLFAVLLILAQRRWRKEYALRRLSEQESAQLQLQQVIEQIDPHFLFNSLNSLYALIRCNPEQAREFTLTLSRVYRRVLERRKQILATLAEEIEFTWQYHSLQQIRFGESLELTTAIDPALRNRRIPAMSLQTLVENAVKHNRISTRDPLRIRIRTEGDTLLIENNCTPRDNESPESLGVGLERIRSVYRFYTDQNITIRIEEGLFRCRLPLLPEES